MKMTRTDIHHPSWGLISVLTLSAGGVYLLFHKWIDRAAGLSSFIMLLMFYPAYVQPASDALDEPGAI